MAYGYSNKSSCLELSIDHDAPPSVSKRCRAAFSRGPGTSRFGRLWRWPEDIEVYKYFEQLKGRQ